MKNQQIRFDETITMLEQTYNINPKSPHTIIRQWLRYMEVVLPNNSKMYLDKLLVEEIYLPNGENAYYEIDNMSEDIRYFKQWRLPEAAVRAFKNRCKIEDIGFEDPRPPHNTHILWTGIGSIEPENIVLYLYDKIRDYGPIYINRTPRTEINYHKPRPTIPPKTLACMDKIQKIYMDSPTAYVRSADMKLLLTESGKTIDKAKEYLGINSELKGGVWWWTEPTRNLSDAFAYYIRKMNPRPPCDSDTPAVRWLYTYMEQHRFCAPPPQVSPYKRRTLLAAKQHLGIYTQRGKPLLWLFRTTELKEIMMQITSSPQCIDAILEAGACRGYARPLIQYCLRQMIGEGILRCNVVNGRSEWYNNMPFDGYNRSLDLG